MRFLGVGEHVALADMYLRLKLAGHAVKVYADDESRDDVLVFAVDTFPYLVQSGMPVVERHFAEARRVLRAGGDFLILNFSYRGDIAADRADVARLAAAHGFHLLVDGTSPLALWNGVAWRLRSAAPERQLFPVPRSPLSLLTNSRRATP